MFTQNEDAALAARPLLIENYIDKTELLTARELSCRLKINLNQLYKLVRRGKIPVLKVGRSLRFQWDAVLNSLHGS